MLQKVTYRYIVVHEVSQPPVVSKLSRGREAAIILFYFSGN